MSEPRIQFSHIEHPERGHDLASPVAVTIPGQDMAGQPVLLLKAVGGLTKLEHVASLLMGQAHLHMPLDADWKSVAGVAIDMAEALLAECAKRQAPKEVEQPSAIEVAR